MRKRASTWRCALPPPAPKSRSCSSKAGSSTTIIAPASKQTIAPIRNVKLESRTSDMKTVYGRTRILLAPSKWEEAWGRVASEAHCSGIPVVGSRRGGLPEAIGSGGVVLDYDASARRLGGGDQAAVERSPGISRLSAAARTFSERPASNPQRSSPHSSRCSTRRRHNELHAKLRELLREAAPVAALHPCSRRYWRDQAGRLTRLFSVS